MMRQVHIYGHLAEKFGDRPLTVDIVSPAEAVRALDATYPGFRQEIRKGEYHVLVKNGERYFDLGQDELTIELGQSREIHIVPVIAGAKNRGGLLKIVLGVALAAGALFMAPAILAGGLGATAFGAAGMGVTYGQLAMVGVSLAIAGVAALLSPESKSKDTKDDSSTMVAPSENVGEQGACVPIVVGRYLVGSVLISVGLSTEQIGSQGLTYAGQG
jgi:predicted phage tail protein